MISIDLNKKTLNESKLELDDRLRAVDRIGAEKVIRTSLSLYSPSVVAEHIISTALEDLGFAWEKGEASLSQIFMAGRIAEDLVEHLYPITPISESLKTRVAIATLDDFHLLGKRIVLSVLRASGFCVLDYGRQTVPDLAARVVADGIEILLVSTLMLRAALRVLALREAIELQGHRIKIIVGGAPFRFDHRLAEEVGADAMGLTASDAIHILTDLGVARV